MLERVLKTIKKYQMFEPLERVVVAVSGGPDSIALLHVLNKTNPRLCLKLCVAHLDHGLRKDSAKDFAFVKKFAQSLKIPFYGRILDRRKIKTKGSLEDCLRKFRYGFLFDVCKKFHAKKIVLGHTKDDQAETVLMRILRGSGLYGLSAILPKRSSGSFEIVRPLIEVSRHEIMKYLKENEIPYRIDTTNLKNIFMRNKIRNNLLPLLEKEYNPNIKEVLSNLALTVGADYNYLQKQADIFLRKNLTCGKRRCSIHLDALKRLDICLRRLVLRTAIESLRGDLRRITFKHWEEMEDLLFSMPIGAQVHLPFDITLSKTKNSINIFKR